jgi:hypothetical protein
MPLCPQITNTPITVVQNSDFVVTSVVPIAANTSDGLANNFESIEILADGKTKVYRQAAAPTGAGINDGDLWIDTDDGNKLYVRASGAWTSAQDGAIATAQATADGKNKIFRQTSAPTASAIGDTWFDTDDGNKLYYWTGAAWVSVQDAAIATAQATADSKIKTFYQTTAPTATGVGDVWFDTDDGNKQYRWNGSSWVSVQDTAIAAATSAAAAATSAAAAAQSAATAAQTTADGKNKIYRQTTQPSTGPFAEGDLWFDTDDGNKIYRYTSGSWATAVTLGDSAIANLSANKLTAGTIDASVITVSNINAGNISTGTLNADRIAAASITGAKIAAGTITASNITAGTITSTEIATGTITASDIAAGTITGSNIAAGTLTASNIAANTITASQIAAATITATQIAAGTITASNIAANTITASQIAAGTITATQIASGTITATQISSSYVYAGTINANQINAGTLTGFLIQTSSGTTAVTLDGATNSMYFKYLGTVYGHILPATSGSVMIHYGATATPGGTAYPQIYVGSGDVFLGQSATRYANVNSTGLDVSGSIFATLDVTADRDLFTPNHTTVTDAANGRVTISLGRVTRSTASSERYKENITTLTDIDELNPKRLLDLPVRAFTYREDYLSESDSRFGALIPGFIAEEVDAVYPVAADYEDGQVESWNDRMIVPGLLALIQDLYKEIKTLKGE